MAWTAIPDGDRDAKSPVSDALFQKVDENLDYLKSVLTDGAAAPQDITVKGAEVTGDLVADQDVQVDGNMNVDGTLTTGVFFSSEQRLWMSGF